MLPVLLSSGAGSLTGPPRAAAKAHRARLVPRAAAGQPQTAAPVHSNGAGKPDGAAREALSNGTPASSQAPAAEPAGAAQPAARRRYLINRIPRSRWENGIPAVMGAHLMGSGEVSPISTSKGAGSGVPHQFSYPDKAAENMAVLQYANADAGAEGIAELVLEAASAAVKERGAFTLVLAGGSLFKALAPLARAPGVDWARWHVFFVDERNVPHSSSDSNFKGADEALLSKVPIPREQIHAIQEGLSVREAATEYEGQLLRLPHDVLPRNAEGWPVFDVILLGIGPDAHVASLFPNWPQTAAKEGWVLPVEGSPKPPPERITFTMPVINSAKEVAVVAFGEGKAEAVQRCLEVQALPGALPAQLVRPTSGALKWVLDVASAQALKAQSWQDAKAFPRSA